VPIFVSHPERVAAGDELLQCFATIGDSGAKLARRCSTYPGVCAVMR